MNDRSDDPLYNRPPVRDSRLAGERWPELALDLNKRTVEKLVTDCVGQVKPGTGRRERIRIVLATLERAAKEFIPRADEFLQADGAKKKEQVREALVDLLKRIEVRVDLLPRLVEPLAWKAIEWGIGRMIDRVHAQLKAAAT